MVSLPPTGPAGTVSASAEVLSPSIPLPPPQAAMPATRARAATMSETRRVSSLNWIRRTYHRWAPPCVLDLRRVRRVRRIPFSNETAPPGPAPPPARRGGAPRTARARRGRAARQGRRGAHRPCALHRPLLLPGDRGPP